MATAQDASFHLEGPMPSGRLILVRHGETLANQCRVFADDDIPLSETGRWQSEQLAQRVARKFRPNVLVSSHLLRARQTSEIIGRVLDLTSEPIPGIQERDLGALKGLPYERFAEAPASVETIDSVTRRAMTALEALRERYPAREIVVVCHGAVIQSVCAYITGVWSEDYPPNCGLVTIEYDAEGWRAPLKFGNWAPLTGSS
jgi:broad specificity phosphatase PhoE